MLSAPLFISMYLNHLRIKGYFLMIVSNAVNQANFNGSRTKQVTVALPPLDEQAQIVAEVDRRLSVVAAVEAEVDANLKRADRLRQSILKRAFEGKLVPQEPSDEPASELLDRILQQRAGTGSPARATQKQPRKVIEAPLAPVAAVDAEELTQ